MSACLPLLPACALAFDSILFSKVWILCRDWRSFRICRVCFCCIYIYILWCFLLSLCYLLLNLEQKKFFFTNLKKKSYEKWKRRKFSGKCFQNCWKIVEKWMVLRVKLPCNGWKTSEQSSGTMSQHAALLRFIFSVLPTHTVTAGRVSSICTPAGFRSICVDFFFLYNLSQKFYNENYNFCYKIGGKVVVWFFSLFPFTVTYQSIGCVIKYLTDVFLFFPLGPRFLIAGSMN